MKILSSCFRILALACALAFLPVAGQANHVRNGDFAEGGRYWNLQTPEGILTGALRDAAMKVEGGIASIHVESLRKGGRGVAADVRLWQKITTLESGLSYILTFEARTTGVGAVGTVNVRYGKETKMSDGTRNTVGGLSITHFDVTDRWQKFEYVFTFNGDKSLDLSRDLESCWLVFAVGNLNRFEIRNVRLVEE